MGEEVWFGMHKIEIVDEHIFPEKREMDYLNVEKYMHWENYRNYYDFGDTGIERTDVILMRYL